MRGSPDDKALTWDRWHLNLRIPGRGSRDGFLLAIAIHFSSEKTKKNWVFMHIKKISCYYLEIWHLPLRWSSALVTRPLN